MPRYRDYDIIVMGGGIGGSAFANAMSKAGANVLLLEKETRFRDRVRGEFLVSWGVVEAHKLGIYDSLQSAGALDIAYNQIDGLARRDFTATTRSGMMPLTFYHPAAQEELIRLAIHSGVEVCRGAEVRHIQVSPRPQVEARVGGTVAKLRAKLVVASDGRTSSARRWCQFRVQQDPEQNIVAGVLLEGASFGDGEMRTWTAFPAGGILCLYFPQRDGRSRVYIAHPCYRKFRLSGKRGFAEFVRLCQYAGAPASLFKNAAMVGPLASFNGRDTWVDKPHKNGVALIGDAAASSDPTWGQGIALTLRDARVLSDKLIKLTDWEAAGSAYSKEHDVYYQTIRKFEQWQTQMFMSEGVEAERIRQIAIPLWQQQPGLNPDVSYNGPDDVCLDEEARSRYFGGPPAVVSGERMSLQS